MTSLRKVYLIARREFLEKVRKKAFVVMTLLGPVFFAVLMVIPVWIAGLGANDPKKIAIVDENQNFHIHLTATGLYTYYYLHTPLELAKKKVNSGEYDGVLHFPAFELAQPHGITYYSAGSTTLDQQHFLEWQVNQAIEQLRLRAIGINPDVLNEVKSTVSITTVQVANGNETAKNNTASTVAGLGCAILIYLFIFMYGIQVMRGVIEEKTNRIIEVIITSVKPFELMMGKILGISTVALLQFLLWILLTFGLSTFISERFQIKRFNTENIASTLARTKAEHIEQAIDTHKIVTAIESLNLPALIAVFLFYFLGGYLLYAALFAAIGASVDNETDTQQFMLPVTVPLVLAFVFAQTVIKSPDGQLAVWLSMIPFTSPIIMLVRWPFGVAWIELAGSACILMISFIIITKLAARIYRAGILMYGKKATFKEVFKWMLMT